MTLPIIVLTSLISLAALNNAQLNALLIFDPHAIKYKKEWWRFFTSGFLHADFMHLFINMFVLLSFGAATEQYYGMAFGSKGTALFVLMYLSGIFAANLSTFYKYQEHPMYRSLGASGAVSAVVFTTILFNPWSKVYLYGIIGLPGILMGAGYLAYSWYMSKKEGDHINHEAHFYGAIYGMLFTIAFKPALFLFFFKQLIGQL